jgi:hypothetical protein
VWVCCAPANYSHPGTAPVCARRSRAASSLSTASRIPVLTPCPASIPVREPSSTSIPVRTSSSSSRPSPPRAPRRPASRQAPLVTQAPLATQALRPPASPRTAFHHATQASRTPRTGHTGTPAYPAYQPHTSHTGALYPASHKAPRLYASDSAQAHTFLESKRGPMAPPLPAPGPVPAPKPPCPGPHVEFQFAPLAAACSAPPSIRLRTCCL